jgi:hypothetical protein
MSATTMSWSLKAAGTDLQDMKYGTRATLL